MEHTRRPKPKIGYFGSGLAAYWPQFPRLYESVMATLARHEAYMLCSLQGDLRVTQTVDGEKGCHMMLAKTVL